MVKLDDISGVPLWEPEDNCSKREMNAHRNKKEGLANIEGLCDLVTWTHEVQERDKDIYRV
jgi:hypothetical protein